MQFLPRLSASARVSGDTADFAREATAGSRLPYSHHVDDHTLALRDGTLAQVIRLDGLMFETADTDELNYRKTLRDAMLRAIGSSHFAVYHHILRRRVEPDLSGSFADDFSRALDAAWMGRLAARKLYANDLFLTIIRRPLQGKGRGGRSPRPDTGPRRQAGGGRGAIGRRMSGAGRRQ